MGDNLASFWTIPATVERFLGTGPTGDKYDTPTTVMGYTDDEVKLIRAADGSQVTSTATFFGPVTTPYIPARSRVTLPSLTGDTASSIVLASAVRTGNGQPTPDHIELALG